MDGGQGPWVQVKKAEGGAVGGGAGGELEGWMDAPGRGGSTAVVNTGALLARWTNDEWKATAHRVLIPTAEAAARDRYSIAFFLDPDCDEVVSTHPACLQRLGAEAKYDPITSKDFVQMKIQEMQMTTK